MNVPAEQLLKGARHAMEQCGLLLRDAVILRRAESHSSAVVLALFGREELGRHRILMDLWRRASEGTIVTLAEVNKACDGHMVKQAAGQLSLVYRTHKNTGLGKLLTEASTSKNPPDSKEYKEARQALEKVDKKKEDRTPGDRQEERMEALYVDLTDSGSWNRPAELSEQQATSTIDDAINDYSGQWDRLQPAQVTAHDKALAEALEKWKDRPALFEAGRLQGNKPVTDP